MTEEEIQQVLRQRKMRDNMRCQRHKRLVQQL
jgi:hypothetical protein